MKLLIADNDIIMCLIDAPHIFYKATVTPCGDIWSPHARQLSIHLWDDTGWGANLQFGSWNVYVKDSL